MFFSLAYAIFCIIILKLAFNKNKENAKKVKNTKRQTKQQRLHKQFLKAIEWAEEVK